jgi:hypothetical protein
LVCVVAGALDVAGVIVVVANGAVFGCAQAHSSCAHARMCDRARAHIHAVSVAWAQ